MFSFWSTSSRSLQRAACLANSVLRDPYSLARIQEWIRNQLNRPKKTQAVSGNSENPSALYTGNTVASLGDCEHASWQNPYRRTRLAHYITLDCKDSSGRPAFQESRDTCASRLDSQRHGCELRILKLGMSLVACTNPLY